METETKEINAALRQQLPTTSRNSEDVATKVTSLVPADIAQDIEARVASGEKKYGTRLRTFNGRNALLDSYQEILDFLNYSIQVYLEGEPEGLELFWDALKLAIRVKGLLRKQCESATNAVSQSN